MEPCPVCDQSMENVYKSGLMPRSLVVIVQHYIPRTWYWIAFWFFWFGFMHGDLVLNLVIWVMSMLNLYENRPQVNHRRSHRSRETKSDSMHGYRTSYSICIPILALLPTTVACPYSPVFWPVPKLDEVTVSFANSVRTCSFSGVVGRVQNWQFCLSMENTPL